MVSNERRYPQLIGNRCKGGWLCNNPPYGALERMTNFYSRYKTAKEAFNHFDEEPGYCIGCRILGFLIVLRRSK